MTLCEMMDEKRFDLVIRFCFYMQNECGMTQDDVRKMIESPYKWAAESREWCEIEGIY